ncbi:hypothetical protein SPRG_07048 [Saprolegnia parasitica CBS 223.65]|uniref:PX domain-containing protein n=1 Tax=Saprolegnia parasitica (strain CBS 223.65) TaxID=695850 RepID=A0A067C9K6_SAPPC|nr:hypothetical protein SPRG_07048 [Saprolegnia parasitica CBS 223.65]KDO27459.1 hypothetical protein SPRG_07048 [Saprolegnia parasitica CBS 223.65]|eukprot:XP_012201897.1 hypothetical protein SPRG_07048 [Saprolegnia parasitica CBS 223.65]
MHRLVITSQSPNKSRATFHAFMQFHIDVDDASGQPYTICKRFREFVALHSTLRLAGFRVPSLPVAGPFMSLWLLWDSASALAHRQFFLQVFLQVLNDSAEIQAHTAFTKFVGTRPETKPGYTSLALFRPSFERSPVRRPSRVPAVSD